MFVLKRLPSAADIQSIIKPSNSLPRRESSWAIGIMHQVSSKLEVGTLTGNSEIKYVFVSPPISNEKDFLPVTRNLTVNKHAINIGVMSSEVISDHISRLKSKMSFDFTSYGENTFDMRALSYTLGCICSSIVAGRSPSIEVNNPAEIATMANAWNSPDSGSAIVVPKVTNKDEWATLACIMRMAGGKKLIYFGECLPKEKGNLLTGETLAAFCLRLNACIVSTAKEFAVASHHEVAFSRGLLSSLRLKSHSDEGGFVREPLINATYPVPTGLIAPPDNSCCDIPTREPVGKNETARWVMAKLLVLAGTVSNSTMVLNDGLPQVLYNPTFDGSEAKPLDYDHMDLRFYDMLNVVIQTYEKVYDLPPSNVSDNWSCYDFFARDTFDRHLVHQFTTPFFWVEPSPLLPHDIKVNSVGSFESDVTVEMPLLADIKKCIVSRNYDDLHGRAVPGCKVMTVLEKYYPRTSGINYLLSSSYNPKNGLSQFSVTSSQAHNLAAKDFLNCDNSNRSLASRRWVLPHCCVPNPCESCTDQNVAILYESVSNCTQLTKQDLTKGVVEFKFTTFYVCKTTSRIVGSRSPKHVPRSLKHYVHRLSNSLALRVEVDSNLFIDDGVEVSLGDGETSQSVNRKGFKRPDGLLSHLNYNEAGTSKDVTQITTGQQAEEISATDEGVEEEKEEKQAAQIVEESIEIKGNVVKEDLQETVGHSITLRPASDVGHRIISEPIKLDNNEPLSGNGSSSS